MASLPPKAPEDRLDVALDHAPALEPGEQLAGAAFTVQPVGLTIDAVTVLGTRSIAWIEGGATNVTYALTAAARTSSGREVIAEAALWVGPPGLDYGLLPDGVAPAPAPAPVAAVPVQPAVLLLGSFVPLLLASGRELLLTTAPLPQPVLLLTGYQPLSLASGVDLALAV